jgi:predicted DNA-binding mobile mystery protein A
MNRTLKRAREVLDKRLSPLRPADRFAPPPKGWVRAIRDALGMSGAQLARRMHVSPQAAAALEQSEASGTVRLETLRKAAAALDCQLVYALVPNAQFEVTVASRARAKALEMIGGVAHSMAMENQQVMNDNLEERIAIFVAETLRDRDLWDET